jgi:hypothetical protein
VGHGKVERAVLDELTKDKRLPPTPQRLGPPNHPEGRVQIPEGGRAFRVGGAQDTNGLDASALQARTAQRIRAAMVQARPVILIVREPVAKDLVEVYARAWFGDMVKIVVDTDRRILTLGGELHADGERLLLEDGSSQASLWGANVYPFRPPADRIEYTALINIRPGRGNPAMDVQDPAIREKISDVVDKLLPP